MSGNKSGGLKAKAKVIERFGLTTDGKSVHHQRIGYIGGIRGRTGGFYWMKANGQLDKIKEAGRKGGRISRRTKTIDA